MGNTTQEFAGEMISMLNQKFDKRLHQLVSDSSSYLIIQPVHWAKVFADREEKLMKDIVMESELNFQTLRRFIIHYLGDAIAYQPVETAKHNYQRVHDEIGVNLNRLSQIAGNDAPLCIISHSLGSVIASNYFYDLQFKEQDVTSVVNGASPLEKGDTLTLFYTLGTSMPLWSLRYHNFDRPVHIPSPKLEEYYPGLNGEWINFYDKDDILGYPLKKVSENYNKMVNEDREVNVGNAFISWNPLSHFHYLTDQDVIEPIVDGLVRAWKQINHQN
ncbi:chemotaxis protein [Bacillus sp. V3-13]|nr:chemotaxis protein [Bacillus sp. V3-13]